MLDLFFGASTAFQRKSVTSIRSKCVIRPISSHHLLPLRRSRPRKAATQPSLNWVSSKAGMELAIGAINSSVLANLPSQDKINCKDPTRSGQTVILYLEKKAHLLISSTTMVRIGKNYVCQLLLLDVSKPKRNEKKEKICNPARVGRVE